MYVCLFLFALFLVGCGEEPIDEHEEELTVDLNISSDHVHTLSEITFSVLVTDHHGNAVPDLFLVEVQRKAHGSDTWRGTELTFDGTLYTGVYTFQSSGEYDIRVVVMREVDSILEIPYEMVDHFEVGRAHETIGMYRIEYEHFPGHVHEGDNATVKFWVKEAEADNTGVRQPIAGLDATIICTNFDQSFENHPSADELESGVYQATHDFLQAGEANLKIEFTGSDQSLVSASFSFNVSHGH